MSRYNDGWSGWRPYVPVAARRANAMRKLDKLRKQGVEIEPVESISGRAIARSFWGKGWCDHLDSFGDYSNRLPRGRTYVRNGSVCHLAIAKGAVDAIVSGSELYTVKIAIEPLANGKWKSLKQRCTGRIGSLLELLQGRLSDEIMGVVTDRKSGLFPLPGEITYECDCPDWAGMCKHIAAVIYGIGARLDERPELLFLLRGVDHEELIDADAATAEITGGGSRRSRRRTLAAGSLEGIFGVELEAGEAPLPIVKRTEMKGAPKGTAKKGIVKKGRGKKGSGKKAVNKIVNRKPEMKPFRPTGRNVAALRRKLGMSKAEFARAAGVSTPTIGNWEAAKGAIRPQPAGLAGLVRLHERAG